MTNLFRTEVTQDMHVDWLGGIRVSRSVPLWAIALIVILLSASLIAYLFLGNYAKKARIPGILVSKGGETNVVATSSGYVVQVDVKEGQHLQVGETILVLDTDQWATIKGVTGAANELAAKHIDARLATLLRERESKQIQAQLRSRATRDRISSIDMELERLTAEIVLQQRRTKLAEANVKRYENLVQEKFVSPIQMQQQQESLIDQESKFQSLERTRLQLKSERKSKESDLTQISAQLQSDIAAVDREMETLGQEQTDNAARRNSVIVSPRAGRISALAVSAGQHVSIGQSLAAIQPEGAQLEAHLFAPSRTVGFVTEDQHVLIRYAAYPYQKFGLHPGRVVSVSNSAFAPNELPPSFQALFGRTTTPESLYRITVTLDDQAIDTYGRRQQLRPGMALEADIVQDRRRIVEWILEPLFAIAART